MRKLLVMLGLACILGAGTWSCRGATEPRKTPSDSVQTFPLQSIAAQPLPWTFADSLKVHNGVIVLRPDSTFLDVLTYDYIFSGTKLTKTDTVSGEYHVNGSTIQFVNRAQGYYVNAGYDGLAITIIFDHAWRYVK